MGKLVCAIGLAVGTDVDAFDGDLVCVEVGAALGKERLYTSMYVCMYICMYVYMYVCMYVCMCCMYPYYCDIMMGRVGMEILLVYTYIIKYFFNIAYMRIYARININTYTVNSLTS